MDVRFGKAIVTLSPGFKIGDPEPQGYLDWHEWAEIQHKGGLRQTQCPRCSRWQFPQSLSTRSHEWTAKDRRDREHKFSEFICLKCITSAALIEAATTNATAAGEGES